LAAVLLMANGASEAATISGSGVLAKVDWVSSHDSTSTNTGAFVDVPAVARTFKAGCENSVVIHYRADIFAKGTAIIPVRVLLDGKPVFPGAVQFNAENPTFSESNCFTWIKRAPAGAHRASSAPQQWLRRYGCCE